MGVLNKPYFRGQSVHRLDAKGRLRIPAKFRDVLQNHYTDALVLTMMEDSLVAFPPEVWDGIESRVKDFSLVDPKQRAFMRYFISSAEECTFDNQGRILIPPVLRERAGLDQEIILAGLLTNFEIWDKAKWDKSITWDRGSYQDIMGVIAGTGL